jgi:hypothetical protein
MRPRLLATPQEIDALRLRIAEDPWAAEVTAALLAEAEELVTAPLDIPHAEGQWSHWYVGEGGHRLVPRSPTEHVDPQTGAVYTGQPYDAVYVAMRHGYWLRGVQKLGMAHALTGDLRYAARVREILLEYASFYTKLRKHSKHSESSFSGARLFAQTLDEAVLACYFASGYDLVYPAGCFSEEDHKAIERGLLRPLVQVIRANDKGTSNWQAWHNAAVGCIGFLLGDRRLADVAINGRHGLLYQLRNSTYGSGLWYELAPIYHWYALNANTYLFEAARRGGMDLYGIPRVRAMFEAPIRLVLPDGAFAPMHDSSRIKLRDDRWFFEVAHARYGEPLFADAAGPRPTGAEIVYKSEDLHEARALGLEASLLTLFWGVAEWPESTPPAQRSSNDSSEGLAVLRALAPDEPARRDSPWMADFTVLFDYGPGHAGHIHPAKLGIVLYAANDIRLVDPGRATYAHPLQKAWYRRTIAHNTAVADETDQMPAQGHLRAYAARDGWTLARAFTEDAYPGVVLDRTLLLVGDTLIDVFQCRGEKQHTWDYPLHLRGGLSGLPEKGEAKVLSEAPGYRELWDTAPLKEDIATFALDMDGATLHITALDESESWFARGHGPIASGEAVPVVLRRQRGSEALFVTVFAPSADAQYSLATEQGVTVAGEDMVLHLTQQETVLTVGGVSWRINQAGALGEGRP